MDRNFYSTISAHLRYDRTVPNGAKFLFSEIAGLTKAKGYCWATNEYFAKLCDTTPRTITWWINKLEAAGYILVDRKATRQGTNIRERRIVLAHLALEDNTWESDLAPAFDAPLEDEEIVPPTTHGEENFTVWSTPRHEENFTVCNNLITNTKEKTEIVKNTISSKLSKKRSRRPQTQIPEDWQISDSLKAWVTKNYPRVTDLFLRKRRDWFVDFWTSLGEVKADWDATFRNHLRSHIERFAPNLEGPLDGNGTSKPRTKATCMFCEDRRSGAMSKPCPAHGGLVPLP